MSSPFPPSILFSYSPPHNKKVSEELIDLSNRLLAHSHSPDTSQPHSATHSLNWEVSIHMKIQKADPTTRPGMQRIALTTPLDTTHKSVPPMYFFRYPDCHSICTVVSNKENNYTRSQVVSGDENLETILTDYSHLIRRSFWKVCGQSYLIDHFIISVGKYEQGNMSNSVLLEVSYVGEDLMSTGVIYESIYAMAKSLIPSVMNNGNEVSSFLAPHNISKQECGNDSSDGSLPDFTLADRCLQWMACLKYNT